MVYGCDEALEIYIKLVERKMVLDYIKLYCFVCFLNKLYCFICFLNKL